MAFLFFLFALFVGLLAFNLYRPVLRHPQMRVVSFLAGWLVGELALHHIVAQGIATLMFALFGALRGPLGALGLAVLLVSWTAMAWFYLQSGRARQEMQTALTHALGDDYIEHIRPELRAHFAGKPTFEALLHPFRILDRDVEVIKNLPFGSYGQKLDIYRPRHRVNDRPVLLQIHGGAWTQHYGSKNEQALPLMNHMALRDWVCVSIDYRLSPKATWPEHAIDCKQGLAWIKNNIADYGGNPAFIVVTGGSAGGHLAALLALTANDPALQPGFEDQDTEVQGAVPFYGVYDFTDSCNLQPSHHVRSFYEDHLFKRKMDSDRSAFEAASPLFRVRSDAPPTLIIHGEKDSLVPVEEARLFSRRLADASHQPVAYAEISNAQHAFDMFLSLRSLWVTFGVEQFLAYLYSEYLDAQTDKSLDHRDDDSVEGPTDINKDGAS